MDYFNNDFTRSESDTLVQEGELITDVPRLIRSNESGDKIYLTQDGKKHWITSPEVLKQLGFEFGQEVEIDKSIMAKLPSADPIRMENVNEFKLPVPEMKEESQENILANTVDNNRVDGLVTIIVPTILSVENVDKVKSFISNLKNYFAGEVILVVKNEVNYQSFSQDFGDKVVDCQLLSEGVERAKRVARGTVLLCIDEI